MLSTSKKRKARSIKAVRSTKLEVGSKKFVSYITSYTLHLTLLFYTLHFTLFCLLNQATTNLYAADDIKAKLNDAGGTSRFCIQNSVPNNVVTIDSNGNTVIMGSTTIQYTGNNYALVVSSGVLLSTAAGNVGIGLINPAYKLDVNGDINLTGQLRQGGIPATFSKWSDTATGISYDKGTVRISTATAGLSVLVVSSGTLSGQELFVVKKEGNVGIGTTNPQTKFDVYGGSICFGNAGRAILDDAPTLYRTMFSSNVYIVGYSSAARYYGDGSGLTNITGSANADKLDGLDSLDFVRRTGNVNEEVTGSKTFSSSVTVTASGFSVGGSTLVVVNGNVGIGTTNPNNTLQVANLINFDNISSGTFVGYQAGLNNTAVLNTFVGYQAGYNIADADASRNTFLGYRAGYTNSVGYANSLVGTQAGERNTGVYNSFFGYQAGQLGATGSYNTFLGNRAGYNSTADGNTFLGVSAGHSNTTGNYNIFIGNRAGNFTQIGSQNTLVGSYAGYGSNGFSFSSSTIVGYAAGSGLTTGSDNILLGWQSGYTLTTGGRNIIIGYGVDAPAPDSSNRLNIGNAIYGDLISGNVGIGTTNPQTKFDVYGGSICFGNAGRAILDDAPTLYRTMFSSN
ncbi:MAG: hypothetical protein V1833_01290, partial [Elusimicrobiota bacterium]